MKVKIRVIFLLIFSLYIFTFNTERLYASIVTGTRYLGDASGNGTLEFSDAKKTAKYIIDADNQTTDFFIDNADYNSDGQVKMNDVVMFLKDLNDPTEVPNGQVIFIPTQASSSNQSMLFKSKDGKLALLDTAQNDETMCDQISSTIHTYAGVSENEIVDLEYLIISHSHLDHTGCLIHFLQNSSDYSDPDRHKINIKNIVIKNESVVTNTYSSWNSVYTFVNENKGTTNLIISNSLDEGYTLTLGSGTNAMKLHLFNVKDIYANESKCWNGTSLSKGKSIGFHSYTSSSKNLSTRLILTDSNGNDLYPYIEFANSTSVSYTNEFLIDQYDTNGAHSYYYAFVRGGEYEACNSNANSIAVLLEVPVLENDVRYLYFPSDLENNGYPSEGSNDTIDGKNVFITGNGTTFFYQYDNNSNTFVTENDRLVPDTEKNVLYPQEYLTSLAISKQIDTSKLVLYQASHHGFNVDKASIDLLNINRNNIYVVFNEEIGDIDYTVNPPYNNILNNYQTRPFYYTFNNVPKTVLTDKLGYGIYYTGRYAKSDNGILEFSIQENSKVRVKAIR